MPPSASTTSSRTPTAPRSRPARRRRPPPRWEGLDVARGLCVLLAASLAVGALLGPDALEPTPWRGLTLFDLVPGLFLVVAGAGAGWRHDAGDVWTTRRRWRRGAALVTTGALVVVARAGGDPAHLAADELLRLAVATGLAALLLRLPRWLLPPLTAGLLLLPAAAVTGDVLGRGLAAIEPVAAWRLEATLGAPTGGVPVVSLPAAVALVLAGHALGTWAHRRPPGPATGAALITVGGWCLVATIVVGQIVAPVPTLLTLPVAAGAAGLGGVILGVGHLTAVWADGAPGLAAVGRTALPLVVAGTVALALVPTEAVPELPTVAALTAGGAVAAAGLGLGRRLDRPGWTLRA